MSSPFDISLVLVAGICLTFGVALAICLGRFRSDARKPIDPEAALQLSSERYRPMLRLLNEDDMAFLRSQPGFRPSMAAKLRAQRCQIFQAYLRSLDQDFRSLCAAIRAMMVQSHHDRPDLARALYRLQISFVTGLVSAEVRVFLYRLGVGSVDVTPLVELFDVTRARLSNIAPAVMAAGL